MKLPELFIPVSKPYKISSPYGPRKDPGTGQPQQHDGIDFVSKSGNNFVYAIADGVVEYDRDDYDHSKRWEKGGTNTVGNRIVLVHTLPDGKVWRSLYFHLTKNSVDLRQKVKKGDIIGEYGDVGYSFGAHLHLKVTNDWEPIDPTPFLEKIKE